MGIKEIFLKVNFDILQCAHKKQHIKLQGIFCSYFWFSIDYVSLRFVNSPVTNNQYNHCHCSLASTVLGRLCLVLLFLLILIAASSDLALFGIDMYPYLFIYLLKW